MGNKSNTSKTSLEETKNSLVQQTGLKREKIDMWCKAITDRSTKGRLSKSQMVSIYKELSNLDSERIDQVVDSLANIFDEDKSGYVDVNEFLRGFILTTNGDLATKIEYTFRLYDENNDNEISGEEINSMANTITRMLGGNAGRNDRMCRDIVHTFLKRFPCNEHGVITKDEFKQTVLSDTQLLALISPFYGNN